MRNLSFVSSWSGGKDSCLAFYCALQKGMQPKYLLHMIIDNKFFPIKKQIVSAQANAINMPIIIKKTSLENYEHDYIQELKKINQEINICVFGDIDCAEHRDWNNQICKKTSLQSFMPLWMEDRYKLINEFLTLGFKATIVTVNTEFLDKSFLGESLNKNLLRKFYKLGIDICGENGEYHTVVTDGPVFIKPLKLNHKGCKQIGQYCYADLELK
jgi:diphthine-ammonia ligase